MTGLFFAALVACHPAPAAAANAQGTTAEKFDPFAVWRPPGPGDDDKTPPRSGNQGPSSTTIPLLPAPKQREQDRPQDHEHGQRTGDTPPPAPLADKDRPRTESPMDDYTDQFERKEFDIGTGKNKQTLVYYMKEPDTSVPSPGYPLVLVLHDTGGHAPAAEQLVLRGMPKKYPAYIVVPVLPRNTTWAAPDRMKPAIPSLLSGKKQRIADVIRLVSQLADDDPMINRKRVYVIGCGEGGYGVFGAVVRYPQMFAAGVPINGGWAKEDAPGLTWVPFFVMQSGDNQTYLPAIARDLSYHIQELGGRISYIEMPGTTHTCDDSRFYSKVLWDWLFAQKKR